MSTEPSMRRRRSLPLICLLISTPALAFDSDLDSIADEVDNCQLAANIDQRDTDRDGFGNVCDADLDNSGVVNFADLGLLKSVFFSTRPHPDPVGEHADFNDDGVVNYGDLGLLRASFALPPGPSGNTPIDSEAAARFLTQATYGPRSGEINRVITRGFEAWLDEQMAIPATLHNPLTRDYATRMCFDMSYIDAWYQDARMNAWWDISLNAPDQLRQRVAYALSQVLVVGDRGEMLGNSQFAVADYYDLLVEHAFGNYRSLLEDMTRHAAMGMFLSTVCNQRAQPEANIRPDENFAREIMQLFTLGVQMLNPDGTPVLDAQGQPIPTYSQSDIEEFARVYTGWSFAGAEWCAYYDQADRTLPMEAFEEYHDTDPKVLFGTPVPGGRTAQQDLTTALNILFSHPNVGPFLAQRLIQRLTTSNPTHGYVERVARAFDDNGAGLRGDLGAVVKAVLLDPEARTGHQFIPKQFGKLREPVLRLSHLRRTFHAVPPVYSGYIYDGTDCGQPGYIYYAAPYGPLSATLAQQPLSSPSVFNFYLPDYSPPGGVRDAGLIAPEFQIFNANTMQSASKVIGYEIFNEFDDYYVKLDLTPEAALADQPQALLERLNLLMLSGQITDTLRDRLVEHLGIEVFPPGEEGRQAKARDAIMLIANSPEYLIQK